MSEKRVLLFNVPAASLEPSVTFLARDPFRVDACATAEELMAHLAKTPYKMIIASLPTGAYEPRDLVYVIRQERHPSSKAVLVVLCPDEKVAEYQPYLAKGVSAIFPLSAPPANLETALGSILHVAPRLNMRIMVRLSAKVGQLASKHLCQVVNISQTGMFVATHLNLPSGSEVVFELLLPQQPSPVTGEAKVARHSRGIGGSSAGLGLQFTQFKLDGRARLDRFLSTAAPKA